MDDYAVFNNKGDEISFVKNDRQEENENENNSKRNRELCKVIVCAILFVCFVICVVIFLGFDSRKETQNTDSTKTTFVQNKTSIEQKRLFVREMMIDAWNAYSLHDWGDEALDANSQMKFGKNSGLSIVASMSTLWTMGLKEEFEKGKKWIKNELDLNKIEKFLLVFDNVAQYVGGLLSCYALTSDPMFLIKANKIAQLMEPSFNTASAFVGDLPNKFSSLTGPIDYQEDFYYLGDLSGESKYRKQFKKMRDILKDYYNVKPKRVDFEVYQDKADEMFTIYMGRWKSVMSYLFFHKRKMYISLVKSYIQSNRLNVKPIEIYKEAMDAMEMVQMFEDSNGGLCYARKFDFPLKTFRNEMLYSSCNLGAMLSLGARAMQRALTLNSSIGDKDKVTQQNRINRHWKLADEITLTCQEASIDTQTGLGPDRFHYTDSHDVVADKFSSEYSLSPEFAESNFILWRLTYKPKYRDNAWKMAQAIHRHCRLEGGGYAEIDDVNHVPTNKYHRQPAHFLSATLKYLYLTFTNDSVLSLDQFVFNSVGHPLPICGNNTMYPTCD